jgi:hypothetical protein
VGSDFWSQSVPADIHERVDAVLRSWLEAKGFEEIVDEPIFDLERDIERGYFLLWDEHWTVVTYSDIGESERLTFELTGKLELPVLHLWTHDSDLWGYELHRDGEVVSAFNSNPHYFGSEEEAEGPNDVPALLDICGLSPQKAKAIRKLQKTKKVFMERICEEFAGLLGVRPSASQYNFLLHRELEAGGFQRLHRRFRKAGAFPMAGFDLHIITARTEGDDAPVATGPDWEELSSQVGEAEVARLKRMHTFARGLSYVVKALTYPFVAYQRLKSKLVSPAAVEKEKATPLLQKVEGDYWIHEPTRSRIRLIEGAEPLERPSLLPFRVGDLEVGSWTMSAGQARVALTERRGASVTFEENFTIGEFPAKAVGWRESYPEGVKESQQIFIQTPWAVIVFYMPQSEPPDPEATRTARRVIETFEITSD